MQDAKNEHPTGRTARIIPLAEVIRLTSRSRSRIYAEIRGGKFPNPVKDGFSSRWLESEIQTWIAERVADRKAPGAAT